MQSKFSCDRGFSLIEVIFIATIIGILSATALSHFAAYRQRSFDTRSLNDIRSAAMGEESYFMENEHYVDCLGSIPCASVLPGFNPSDGVVISMFQVTGSGPEYFTGQAYHLQGSRNTAETAFIWNSSNSGLQ